MVEIEKHLLSKIRTRFGDQPVKEARGTEFKAIFRGHPTFGDIEVSDENDEITMFCGRFTHCHFAADGEPAFDSPDAYAQHIAEEAVEFLADVFSDEYLFWSSHEGRRGGCSHRSLIRRRGWIRRTLSPNRYFVWSGRAETH